MALKSPFRCCGSSAQRRVSILEDAREAVILVLHHELTNVRVRDACKALLDALDFEVQDAREGVLSEAIRFEESLEADAQRRAAWKAKA